VAPSSVEMRIGCSINCSYLKRKPNAKERRKNEKIFAGTKVIPHLNLAAILTRIRHFESVKKLFFYELWLTKCLPKTKRENAKMLDFRGVLTETSIFDSHFQFKRHFETKQNSSKDLK
jgi:hypothetical protein